MPRKIVDFPLKRINVNGRRCSRRRRRLRQAGRPALWFSKLSLSSVLYVA